MWEALVTAVAAAVTSLLSDDVNRAVRFAHDALVKRVRRALGAEDQSLTGRDPGAIAQALEPAVEDDPALALRLQSLLRQLGVDVEVEPAMPGPVLLTPTAPRQLPTGSASFVNRAAELSTLDRVGGDAPGSTPLVVLRGAPGVGKLALALRWGHHRQERFTGGQFFADLRGLPTAGVDGGPELGDEALTSFLQAMGVPSGLLPDSFAARQSLFRTLSAERPVLVVLRGAALPAQIRPLIPTAPGSLVLVSTQHDVGGLAMDGARFVDVEPLDAAAALDLLTATCGGDRIEADRAAATRLVELCGRLPVAILVIGGRLNLDPSMTVTELAAEVAGEPYLLDALALPGAGEAVEPLFNNAYRYLPADAQRLYRDFGAVPVAEISDDLLARIGWPDRAARRAAVDRLLGMKLLERRGRNRYAQHALIRAHAERLAHELDPDDAERVVTGTVAYFVEFAQFADRAVMGTRRRLAAEPEAGPSAGPSPFADRPQALEALERSREDLLRVARVAVAAGDDRSAVRLGEAAQALYFNHRHLADWIEMARLAIRAAQRLGRPDIEAQERCVLCRALIDAGRLEAAGVEIEAALALLPRIDDLMLPGTVWEFSARYLDRVARAAPAGEQPAARERAEAAYRTTIDVYLSAQERGAEQAARGAALGRFYFGGFLDATGRSAEALGYLQQAREGFEVADDDRMSTRADAAIGAAHLHLGHDRQAYDELATAAAYLAAAGLWHYEATVRDNLALAANALGDRAGAAEHAQRAAEIRRWSEPAE